MSARQREPAGKPSEGFEKQENFAKRTATEAELQVLRQKTETASARESLDALLGEVDLGWRTRQHVLEAVQDSKELVREILTMPDRPGRLPPAWWWVEDERGRVIVNRPRYAWDPDKLLTSYLSLGTDKSSS